MSLSFKSVCVWETLQDAKKSDLPPHELLKRLKKMWFLSGNGVSSGVFCLGLVGCFCGKKTASSDNKDFVSWKLRKNFIWGICDSVDHKLMIWVEIFLGLLVRACLADSLVWTESQEKPFGSRGTYCAPEDHLSLWAGVQARWQKHTSFAQAGPSTQLPTGRILSWPTFTLKREKRPYRYSSKHTSCSSLWALLRQIVSACLRNFLLLSSSF